MMMSNSNKHVIGKLVLHRNPATFRFFDGNKSQLSIGGLKVPIIDLKLNVVNPYESVTVTIPLSYLDVEMITEGEDV
jgi:hypothetical protein